MFDLVRDKRNKFSIDHGCINEFTYQLCMYTKSAPKKMENLENENAPGKVNHLESNCNGISMNFCSLFPQSIANGKSEHTHCKMELDHNGNGKP